MEITNNFSSGKTSYNLFVAQDKDLRDMVEKGYIIVVKKKGVASNIDEISPKDKKQ